MRTFTVKDFITYNGPCFSCNSKINFKIGSKTQPQTTIIWQPDVYLTPVVTNDFIDIDLKINYNDGLNLKIFTKTNKFTTSSMKGLIKYLEGHKLYLRSRCDKCSTGVDSQILEFNILKEFIKPVGISDEQLIVKDDKYLYELHSSFEHEYSTLIISTVKPSSSSIRMNLPLLPMYKLKTKDKLIQKAKTYILFS